MSTTITYQLIFESRISIERQLIPMRRCDLGKIIVIRFDLKSLEEDNCPTMVPLESRLINN